ncbi:MAG: PilZ domain-containing protein [Desulfobacteraceae bacterium]|jgi:hypothetical protein
MKDLREHEPTEFDTPVFFFDDNLNDHNRVIENKGRYMKDFRELREHERTEFDTPVLFSDDNLNNHHRAMMQNFSDQGMYFESTEYMRPGSTVYVKTINYCSVNKCQVRWCNRIDQEGNEMFGIGLQCEI